jgi:hypothetical protein
MPFALALYLVAHRPQERPQGLDTQVTLKETANVATLLKNLSAQAGIPLTINERRGQEILIVAVDRVSLADAMKQIAWATYGRWEKSGGGYRLLRDTDAENAAEKEYVRWQTREAATAIGNVRDLILERGLAPDRLNDYSIVSHVNAKATATDRALAQALSVVRPENAILVQPDSWCVYSTHPTSAEYPLGPVGTEILRAYNASLKDPSASPAVLATLTCDYRFEQGTATLSLFTDRGWRTASASARFGLHDRNGTSRPRELADEVPDDQAVPLSEASKFFVRPATQNLTDPYGMGPGWSNLRQMPDVMERIRNPEKFEPLATFATDVWRTIATWKGRNLVANIDDAFMYPGWAADPPNLRAAFKQAGGYNAVLQPGWLLARPSLASPPWRHRVDRAALGRLARTAYRNDMQMFEAYAAFAGSGPVGPDPWETNQYLSWAGTPTPEIFHGWDVARIFGTVPKPVLAAWVSGESIPIASLPVATKQALRKYVLGQTYYDDYNYLRKYPTVRFPQGLPEEGTLVANIHRSTDYYTRRRQEDGSYNLLQPEVGELADKIRQWMSTQPERLRTLEVMEEKQVWVDLQARFNEQETFYLFRFTQEDTRTGFSFWNQAPEALKQRILSAGKQN